MPETTRFSYWVEGRKYHDGVKLEKNKLSLENTVFSLYSFLRFF